MAFGLLASVTLASAMPNDPIHIGCHTWPVSPDAYGPPNTIPVANFSNAGKLVSTSPNGRLYRVDLQGGGVSSPSSYYVAHVYGTPQDWGTALGTLYKPILKTFIDSLWAYMKTQVESIIKNLPTWLQESIAELGLEEALDMTYKWSKDYTDPRIHVELEALAAAGNVDLPTIIRVHMIAGLTQGRCSMFGAWGKALDPSWGGELLQLRALDWDMDSPVRDYSAVTVYHPSNPADGHNFAIVGMVGFVGALTGVSEKQLGISEIGVSFPDADTFGSESRKGTPFIFVLREILQYDNSLNAALDRMSRGKRTCDLILGVGDGKAKLFRSVAYSSSKIVINDDVTLRPLNDTWHAPLPSIVYHGMDWMCPSFNLILHNQLSKYYGQLNPLTAIKYISAVEQSGDNHIALYDLTNLGLYLSFASPRNSTGSRDAYAREYTFIDLRAAFKEPKPSI